MPVWTVPHAALPCPSPTPQPVVVAISSSAAPVKNYAAGVLGSSGSGDAFAACCPRGKDCKDDVDHAVVVVGYSTQGALAVTVAARGQRGSVPLAPRTAPRSPAL